MKLLISGWLLNSPLPLIHSHVKPVDEWKQLFPRVFLEPVTTLDCVNVIILRTQIVPIDIFGTLFPALRNRRKLVTRFIDCLVQAD